jgi:hypothetical protein
MSQSFQDSRDVPRKYFVGHLYCSFDIGFDRRIESAFAEVMKIKGLKNVASQHLQGFRSKWPVIRGTEVPQEISTVISRFGDLRKVVSDDAAPSA